MSRISCLYAERNGCSHKSVQEDLHEGTLVCLDCALVLETILFLPSITQLSFISNEENLEKRRKEEQQILDICELWHIDRKEVYNILNVYEKLIKQIGEKYKNNELLAFAIFSHLTKNNYICSPDDIVCLFQLSNKKILFRILNETDEILEIDTNSYSERNCSSTIFNYKEKTLISKICKDINEESKTSFHPKTLSLLVMYYYCKLFKSDVSLKTIAQLCSVHVSRIYKLIKSEKANYIKQFVLKSCKNYYI